MTKLERILIAKVRRLLVQFARAPLSWPMARPADGQSLISGAAQAILRRMRAARALALAMLTLAPRPLVSVAACALPLGGPASRVASRGLRVVAAGVGAAAIGEGQRLARQALDLTQQGALAIVAKRDCAA